MTSVRDFRAADDEVRRSIIDRLDQTMFVEAGAGTGKTRALVDRVVAHVLAGIPVDRIIAITFTEKAAAELRERVRRGLEEHTPADDTQRTLIEDALKSLDRARISTIHSFAQSLLYAYAAEAGIDPSFRVQDEVLAARRLQEQWRLYLERLAGEREALTVFDRVLSLGLGTREIELLAMKLVEKGELIAVLDAHPIIVPAPFWPDLAGLRAELEALPLDVRDPDDPLRQKVVQVLNAVRTIESASDRESALTVIAGLEKLKWGVGRQDDWGGADGISRVRDVAKRAQTALVSLLSSVRAEALAELIPYIVRFTRDDATARGRDGLMTFDDLILLVRNLLRDHAGAAASLRDNYDLLMIDEFQDTDPLQVDIARSFARDPNTDSLDPGRLFLVGDPKQSIYRFRRADMAIYSATRTEIEAQAGVREVLALNRRSRSQIVDWVNSVFAPLIGDGSQLEVQPAYEPIHPDRQTELRGPGVGVYGEMLDGPKAREVRALDAEVVAGLCQRALQEGWEVMDRETGEARPVHYRDIAILIPTRNILVPLERSLADAGVPYRIEGGSLVYRTQEIRDVVNFLTAIDDPYDEIAVVATLRSPAFACSDVDLAEFRADNRSFNYLSSALAGQQGRVADSLKALASYHANRHRESLSALVTRLVTDRALVEVGILDRGDRHSFRRMRFMIEQARAFEAEGPESLRAFVTWLESRAETAIRDHEGSALDDDEDAVRVLTVHGAKGLEFPVVILCGLGSAPLVRPGVYSADHITNRVAVRVGSENRGNKFEAGPVDELQDLEKAHEYAEYRRLLYVAATRARDHLVVSLFHTKNASACGAHLLDDHGARNGAITLDAQPPVSRTGGASIDALQVDIDPSLDPDAFRPAREQLVAAARGTTYTSATALKDSQDSKDATDDDTEPWARGRGGTRLGRAVHAAIQSLDLGAGPSEIAAFAKAQATAEAIPHRENDVAALVSRALSSEAAARARSASRTMREVPFAVGLGEHVVEGFVDMLIETTDGLEIVDWKTDQISAGDVPERLRKYELQAGLYALGVARATNLAVHRVTYVFVSAGREESPGDPDELARRAEEVISGSGLESQLRLLDA